MTRLYFVSGLFFYACLMAPAMAKGQVQLPLPSNKNDQKALLVEADPFVHVKTFKAVRQELAPAMQNPSKSTSVVWVEPGERTGTIRLILSTHAIPKESIKALNLKQHEIPKLGLSFTIGFGSNGIAQADASLGNGTVIWGATKGPVQLAGKPRRNLKGSVVKATWRKLTYRDLFELAQKPENRPEDYYTTGFVTLKYDVSIEPPCLAPMKKEIDSKPPGHRARLHSQ